MRVAGANHWTDGNMQSCKDTSGRNLRSSKMRSAASSSNMEVKSEPIDCKLEVKKEEVEDYLDFGYNVDADESEDFCDEFLKKKKVVKKSKPVGKYPYKPEYYGLTEEEMPEDPVERRRLISKLRMRKMRADETPEQRENRLKDMRERQKERVRKMLTMTPEESEAKLKKRKHRTTEPKEEDRAPKKIDGFTLPPEEELPKDPKERYRLINRLRTKWYADHEDPEKRRERRRRYQEKARNKKDSLPTETLVQKQQQIRQMNEKRRRRRELETPEEREERLERLRCQRLLKKAAKTEEEIEEEKTKRYFADMARFSKLTQEELEARREKNKERNKQYYHSLTGEKKEKHLENVKKAVTKYQTKNKAKFNEYLKKRAMNESPEQRWKRLLGYRIRQAKRLLSKKLEKSGVAPEVIQKEVDKLVERMKAEKPPPWEELSKYKPREAINTENVGNDHVDIKQKSRSASVSHTSKICDVPVPPPTSYFAPKNPPSPTSSLGSEVQLPTFRKRSRKVPYSVGHEQPMPTVEGFFSAKIQADFELSSTDNDSSHFINEEDNDDNFDNDPNYAPSLPPDSPQSPSNFIPDSFQSLPVAMKNEIVIPKCEILPSSSLAASVPIPSCSTSIKVSSNATTQTWKCPKCKQVINSKQAFAEHYTTVHKNEEDNKTPEPERNSKSTRKKRGKKLVPSLSPFICMKCPKVNNKSTFSAKYKLLEHVKQKHSKDFYPCPNCNLLKYSLEALNLHLSVCKT